MFSGVNRPGLIEADITIATVIPAALFSGVNRPGLIEASLLKNS